MILNAMNWDTLKHEYGLDAKRLMPWAALKAPFEGAWCVVRSNSKTTRHAHSDRELFIGVEGEALVIVGDEVHRIRKGDFIAIPPATEHHIDNPNAVDFEMMSVWWDNDLASRYVQAEEVSHG